MKGREGCKCQGPQQGEVATENTGTLVKDVQRSKHRQRAGD